jgi:hypothetical protein
MINVVLAIFDVKLVNNSTGGVLLLTKKNPTQIMWSPQKMSINGTVVNSIYV